MPTRSASATWEGGLQKGKGSFKTERGLGAAYSFSSRFEEGTQGSNPEELLAASHASCYSMALAVALERNGTPAQSVETSAHCTVAQVGGGFRITTMKLDVRVRAQGVDQGKLTELARQTHESGCPISGALKGNVDVQVDAKLA